MIDVPDVPDDPAILRAKVRRGDIVLGTFVLDFFSLGIGELAARSGAEFVVLDAEHSGRNWETLGAVTAVARRVPVGVIIRIADGSPSAIAQALDLGAHGVMVPMVETAEAAAAIVRAAKYPPIGGRGAAFGWSQGDGAVSDPAETMRRRNEESLVIVQIETAAGVDQVESIAAVDGIDALWIGQLDLSASLGAPGDLDSPAYMAAVDRIVTVARQHGIPAGFADLDGTATRSLVEQGFTLIAVGADSVIYSRALTAAIENARMNTTQDGDTR